MSKFDDVMAAVTSEVKTSNLKVDAGLLLAVAKSLGPSIYLKDASKVSCSDKSELATVKKNYLMKKLGLEDGPALDEAINEVCEKFGSSNRNKYRIIFYAMLAEKFNKTDIYS